MWHYILQGCPLYRNALYEYIWWALYHLLKTTPKDKLKQMKSLEVDFCMFAYMYISTGKGIIINIMNRVKWICSWHFQILQVK